MHYKKGFKLALATAGFSGVAVFLNSLTVKAVGDALVFTTIKNLGVAVILGIILMRKRVNWGEVKKQWPKLVLIGIIGGSLPFYLFFKGLMTVNPATGALIHKTLIFWVALWAVPILKEKISVKQWLGLGIIFGSNFVIGGLPHFALTSFAGGKGEMMILGATLLWAIENIIAKLALKNLSAEIVSGARMILGSLILVAVTLVNGKINLIFKLSGEQWLMTGVSILMLTGYVLNWYKALKIAPVTLVASTLTLGTIITNILSSIFITHSLQIELLYQIILFSLGMWFFVKEARKNDWIIALR